MIKYSCQCKREQFSVPLAFTSLGGTVLALVLIFTGRYTVGFALLLLTIYLLKTSIFWFFNLKRHYEFDHDSGVVNLVTTVGKKETVKQIASVSEIETFAVAAIKNWAKTGTWWTYHIVMILKNGKVYNIGEPSGSKGHHEVLKKAGELAQMMDCPCFQSVHEQALAIKTHPGRVEVSNREWRLIDTFKFQGRDILFALAFFVAILLLIVGISVSL